MSTGDPRQSRSFKIRVWLARLVVTAERLWPSLWPALAVLGIFAIVSLFGLWLVLPRAAHLVLLAGFAAALGFALWRARSAMVPATRDAGLSRLRGGHGGGAPPPPGPGDRVPRGFPGPPA